MRRPSGHIPSQPITHMWPRHDEIARRLAAGDRQVDICQDMNISQSRMSILANSPKMQKKVAELSKNADNRAQEVAERLQALSENAVDVLEEVIKKNTTSFNAPLQVKVAESILDRTGYSKTTKLEGGINHRVSAEGVLGDALRALRERARAGSVVGRGGNPLLDGNLLLVETSTDDS